MAFKPDEESTGSTESYLTTEESMMVSSGSTNAAQTGMESLIMTPARSTIIMASKPDEESTGSTESYLTTEESMMMKELQELQKSDLTNEEPPIVGSTDAPEIEDAIHEEETEQASSTQKRKAPGYPNGFRHDEKSKKNAKMNSSQKPFAVPASDVRWTGIAMAHGRVSHDGAVNARKAKTKKKKKQDESDGVSMVVNMLQVILYWEDCWWFYSWPPFSCCMAIKKVLYAFMPTYGKSRYGIWAVSG
ncbi:hypothetical protein OS493_034766 [Desmophyllum pertusum]|uniref:Uncharacterized protein n=1 Tax=Desmophyllum pertusum TaxID=174260 RepID=A0A9X0CQ24_9CNID|nr:hypothetical protein OS493_034766 [Desmophyllum pertusum]